MKFGNILEERRHPEWRCISYDSLKKQIRTSDATEESVKAFFDAVIHEIEEVDCCFEQIKAAFEKKDQRIDAARLRSHAVLNYLAVLKILKKHDKRIQKSFEDLSAVTSPKQVLFKTSFCTSISSSSALFIDDHHAKSHRRRRRASSSTNPCPVCFEELNDSAAILPCNHRFCWPCLSNCATQGLASCPLCRKEQSLEPVNLEIQTILGCMAQQYYPTNQAEIPRSNSPFSDEPTNSESQCSVENDCDCSKAALPSIYPDSPRTPEAAFRGLDESPPAAPRRKPRPPLMKALGSCSLKDVKAALQEDAEAAQLPFFEHSFEPPLCYAVRVGAGKEIFAELLQNGASVHATDTAGKTPLAILSSASSQMELGRWSFFQAGTRQMGVCISKRHALQVAQLLLDARADPSDNRHFTSCLDLAQAAGNSHLVDLFLGEPTLPEEEPGSGWIPPAFAFPSALRCADALEPPPLLNYSPGATRTGVCLPGGSVWLVHPS